MPTDRIATMARQDRARELHEQGMTWQEVAAECGYRSRGAAYEGALSSARRDPGRGRNERIALHNERLEWLISQAELVYRRKHYVVAGKDGVIVYGPKPSDGLPVEPLDDDAPKLEALKLIKSLDESQRKLWGDDAPTRKIVEVITEDVIDAEIRRLEAELAATGQVET